MPRYLPEAPHEHGAPERTGILLINLGTPDSPTPAAVRRYLGEFLADPRVVELPRPIWLPILHGIILRTRPRKSAEKYAAIWTREGSPLLAHTEKQAKLLRGLLGARGLGEVAVDFAMRYGEPSVANRLDGLRRLGCTRILVLPLYPQYAASTTASAMDAVFAHLARVRNQPEIRSVRHYHDHPGYIAALAASVREHWQREGRSEVLVMSFHGLPRKSLDAGDPYHCECLKTGRLLAESLGLEERAYRITFQSRFGRAEWLQPYTAATLEALARDGVHSVDVICPGFASDCLETLEEIALEGKAGFLAAGGGEYRAIPCLNERDDWIAALADIAETHLQGWPTALPDPAALQAARERAIAQGAGA